MRESRTYGSGRGACHEMHVPTATEAARVHHAARRCGGGMAAGGARAKLGKVAKLGILAVAREAPRTKPAYEAFFAELQALGFKEGTNLTSETHWIDEDTRGPLTVAAEIAQSAVDVLVIEGAESVLKAAMAANPNLPIVVYANNYDPIERGYAKLSRSPVGM